MKSAPQNRGQGQGDGWLDRDVQHDVMGALGRKILVEGKVRAVKKIRQDIE